VRGVVRLLAQRAIRAGHVRVEQLDIEAADACSFDERLAGYGVEVVPGAFTLWNRQKDPAVTITAEIIGLSAGRAGAPFAEVGCLLLGPLRAEVVSL
jgi:hypothetical protein